MEITVHPLTQEPTKAFELFSKTGTFKNLPLKNPSSLKTNHVRVVCMSDTHCEDDKIKFKIPPGDIFIHAGDFTRFGDSSELIKFNHWLKSLPHPHKVIIAGNHDLSFDKSSILYSVYLKSKFEVTPAIDFLNDCIYLEDSFVELFGLKIYGSPWQPEHGGLAFNLPRGANLLSKWNLIPEDVDILVTHGPPLGHGDRLANGNRAGCVELLATVQNRVKPKFHVFGHIHEGYGTSTDGNTVFINASTCNKNYMPVNAPIVFDIEVKSA